MAAPELPGVPEIGIEQANHSHGRRGKVGASSGIATSVRRPRGNHTGVRESGAISTFRNRWLYPLRQLLLWDLRNRDDAGGSDLTAGGDPHELDHQIIANRKGPPHYANGDPYQFNPKSPSQCLGPTNVFGAHGWTLDFRCNTEFRCKAGTANIIRNVPMLTGGKDGITPSVETSNVNSRCSKPGTSRSH